MTGTTCTVVPLVLQLLPFGCAEQAQLGDSTLGRAGHLGQELRQRREPACSRGGVEEIAVEQQRESQASVRGSCDPAQVERRDLRGRRKGLRWQAREIELHPRTSEHQGGEVRGTEQRGLLQRKRHLEQRRAAGIPLRLQALDEQGEGIVLVGERGEHRRTHCLEQFVHPQLRVEGSAQHHRVDEIADNALQRGPPPPPSRGPNHHLALLAELGEKHLERGQEQRVEGHALGFGKRQELVVLGGRQDQLGRSTRERLMGRTRTVGGQGQSGEQARELGLPITRLPFPVGTPNPCFLLMHIVEVGHRQGQQPGRRPGQGLLAVGTGGFCADELPVECAQFCEQHPERGEVRDQVMRDQHQQMLLGPADEHPNSQQGIALQSKRAPRFVVDPGAHRSRAPRARVFAHQGHRTVPQHLLIRSVRAGMEGRAQGRVAVDQQGERAFQQGECEPAADHQSRSQVVGRALGSQLLQEPQRTLAMRERTLER